MSSDKTFKEYSTNLVVGPVTKPRWIYSISKQLLDRIIIALAEKKQLEYTIFRPFNWIGPKIDSLKQAELRNGRVLTIFIYNLLYNKDIVLVGNGKQKRSFTYIDDGISALNTIIENKKNNLNGKIFNIGNPKNNISIKKLAEILISKYQLIYPNKFKGKIVCKSEKEFYGKSYEDIPLRVPDISEAKKYLNWTPKDDVYSSVSKTLKSFIDANK
jgi:nucleoside-diphosphate-sugar epimerase